MVEFQNNRGQSGGGAGSEGKGAGRMARSPLGEGRRARHFEVVLHSVRHVVIDLPDRALARHDSGSLRRCIYTAIPLLRPW